MAQPPETTAGGAQPHVSPEPLNFDKGSSDVEEDNDDMQGGSNSPNLTGAPYASQQDPSDRPIDGLGGCSDEEGLGNRSEKEVDTDDTEAGSNSSLTSTAAFATEAGQVNLTGQDRNYYRPLLLAAQRGDWKAAKSFIDHDPHALTARITDKLGTVLLVAAKSCRWEFVLKLFKLLEIRSPESIARTNSYGCTVLHYVAQAGTLRTAKALVEQNSDLLHMANNNGFVPLRSAIVSDNKELVWYFSLKTKVDYRSLPKILRSLNQTGLLDVSLYFFLKYPELALHKKTALLAGLAGKPSHFFSGSSLGFFKRWIYKLVPVNMEEIPGSIEGSPALQQRSFVAQAFQLFKRLLWKAIAQLAPSIKVVRDMKLRHECAVKLVNLVCVQLSSRSLQEIIHFLENPKPIMETAIENGIEEIVSTLLQYFPDLIDESVARKRNILQAAIEYRQEKIVNIVKEISPIATKNLCIKLLESKNTTLHLVGELAPPFKLRSVSGAALQMQRELQWFKEVEKITLPYQRERKNSAGKTPMEVFWKAHKRLAVEGEEWMKDTADSCMLVSTLIATVLFAAAFTVPGGNINDKGTPIFLRANAFVLFAFSDAIGLFSSLTSLLMFLAIRTSRYGVDDFLESLPKKLIIGLGSLFLAIAAMITAFGATLTIILNERWHWVSVPIIALASFPVAIFVMLQLPLFIQMVQSTYGRSIFHA